MRITLAVEDGLSQKCTSAEYTIVLLTECQVVCTLYICTDQLCTSHQIRWDVHSNAISQSAPQQVSRVPQQCIRECIARRAVQWRYWTALQWGAPSMQVHYYVHRVHCTQIGGAIPVTTICSSCRRDWLADNLLEPTVLAPTGCDSLSFLTSQVSRSGQTFIFYLLSFKQLYLPNGARKGLKMQRDVL